MSGLQSLKVFISQRLTAAVDEVLGHLERTIREYEETERRHRDLLLLTAEKKQRKADGQQLSVRREDQQGQTEQEVQEDQQVQESWGDQQDQQDQEFQQNEEFQQNQEFQEDQEDLELPYIKEEQDELWSSQEGEQLQGLQEAEITKFTFSPVSVKTEDDEEKPQSSQLHYRHSVGGPERGLEHVQPGTADRTPHCSEPGVAVNSVGWNICQKSFSCSECGKRFGFKGQLEAHMRCHTGERPFRCSVCKKCFSWSGRLQKHMRIHTGEKPFSCSVCGKSFVESGNLKVHMRIHTGEKPFGCSVCGKRYAQRGNLQQHMVVHRGDPMFSCSVCNRRFTWLYQLNSHECVPQSSQLHHSHTEQNTHPVGGPEAEPHVQPGTADWTSHCSEPGVAVNNVGWNICQKSFSCSECGKRFGFQGQLKAHMRCHTGERPFRCSVCKKCFSWNRCLQKHMKIHTGEKPFSCSVCGKGFVERGNLKVHMRIHTGEKPFGCSICGKSYAQRGGLTKHLEVHRGKK
ncbi:gastrula zinc finger protein XlCGF57.1-like [Amphiprion ocellaris]|uniref:C2H2-type domain-containing protein n=1 Tax=Amphiprion ocellaris TaxID=80972 RepID=A0A3Q1CIE4_AMPOC|nr:gastrula zinc finger protein XlCGF57.1-like [Amphiprion ocellaris]